MERTNQEHAVTGMVTVRGRALVLGPLATAQHIADSLENEGLRTVAPSLSDDQLPSVLDPEASRKLQELLTAFAQEETAGERGLPCYLHPGASVWADRPELLTVGKKLGLHVIAPSARVLTLFGNKLSLFQEAEALGVPSLVIPPAEPIHSLREIEAFIRRHELKFPFILKSAKGSTRLGMTVIHEAQELESKLPLWIEQLRRNCGEVILFCERYLEGARQLTVPFARLLDGRSVAFPLVDGSLEGRHRRLIEFCPAERIDPEVETRLRAWALDFAQKIGYVGVGALEFLVDGQRPYLVGGSARLDPAFPLWESVVGTSAIAWQIAAMQGGASAPLPAQSRAPAVKSALALRIYAEDPVLQLPQPGMVREISETRAWDFPSAHARLELSVEPGQDIRPTGQGLIGTLWVSAQSRSQAILTARGALDDLWIAGSLQTNERFLAEILQHPWVREGIFHTAFIDEEFIPALRPPIELSQLFASVVQFCGSEETRAPVAGERWAVGDQWVKPDRSALEWAEGPLRWTQSDETNASPRAGVSGRIRIADGRTLRVCAYPLSDAKWQVRIGGWVMMARRIPPKAVGKAKAPPKLSSMIPGRVHSVLYRNGAVVPAHEPLLIVESLGMLIPHALPVEVRIQRWKVVAEERVGAGQELAEFEILSHPVN